MKNLPRVLPVLLLASFARGGQAHGAAPATRPATAATTAPSETRVPVTFTGGHELGRDDYGRPCALMAAALGVKTDAFRKAFSGVTPAKGRGPNREEAQKNKDALLKVLAPLGVTNERLDAVANHYRFKPQDNELWPTSPAKAYAVVEGGVVKRVVVTEPGFGYNEAPAVKIEGFEAKELRVTLGFGKEFKANGTVAAVELLPAK